MEDKIDNKNNYKKLLLIDTFYFIHRSFHAYPKELQNSKGEYTNILYGFSQSLIDLMIKLRPTHIACAWESEEMPSFRKVLYPDYQITRIQMEVDDAKVFSEQLSGVIKILNAFNIPRITENGFEGDDVIGTCASIASNLSDVIIATSDQDIFQLITDNVSIYRPSKPPYVKEQLITERLFKEKYGFNPIQMIDYKSLRGDPSDNIPGVLGIGEVTAKKLINEYGSLENIYLRINDIKPEGLKTKLMIGKEKAFLSKQLATIITNIPIPFDLDNCIAHDFNMNKVKTLFEKYEFKSLLNRLNKLEISTSGSPSTRKREDTQISIF
jgi:DNA polymerase I